MRGTTRIDERIDLERAIEALTDKQREAVMLWSHGYSHAEIGERLETPRRTISHWIEASFLRLRQKLDGPNGPESLCSR